MNTDTVTVENFIGDKAKYDNDGTMIWGVKGDKLQRLLDLRGWGAIQNLFAEKDGVVNLQDSKEAESFQDELGEWIADAINKKLASHLSAASPETELRWVKASDRKPDSWHNKVVRYVHTKTVILDIVTQLEERPNSLYHVIEWLEEIPATPQQDSKEKKAGSKQDPFYKVRMSERAVEYFKNNRGVIDPSKFNQAQQDSNPPAQPSSVSEGQGEGAEESLELNLYADGGDEQTLKIGRWNANKEILISIFNDGAGFYYLNPQEAKEIINHLQYQLSLL
jgi:hypothetical protein